VHDHTPKKERDNVRAAPEQQFIKILLSCLQFSRVGIKFFEDFASD
jgi:hypothetical protein